MINKLTTSINYRLSKLLMPLYQPRMIVYTKNFQGVKKDKIRISNSTFIDNKEKLFLSENIFIGHHNFIEASNEIYIGKGCQITNFVSITTHSSHHSIRYYGGLGSNQKEKKGYIRGSIHIGEYTFIGPHTLILPNTKIGKACIVSAFSHIKGDFEDFSIIAGNPAKKIGDVREMDNFFLEQNPELKGYYLS